MPPTGGDGGCVPQERHEEPKCWLTHQCAVLQVQNTTPVASTTALTAPPILPYAGPIDCLRRSVAEEGVSVLFRGHVSTLLREVPGTAVWFCTYEAVVRATAAAARPTGVSDVVAPLLPSSPLVVIGAGGLAGCAYWMAIYPVDTIKTAQQTAAPGSLPQSFTVTLAAILRAGGVRALYAGMAPTLLRAFPSNAAVFLLYEQAIRGWAELR